MPVTSRIRQDRDGWLLKPATRPAQATRLIESLSPAEPAFVASVVLVEALWVMEDVYSASRDRLGEIVEALLETEVLVVDRPSRCGEH
jgi:predicted nucleic-acid-binding protein